LGGGGAGGAAAPRAARANDHGPRPTDSRSYWDRIGSEWGLTASQRTVIDSLMDAQRRKISALYKPLRPTMDSVNAQARAVSDSTLAQLRLVLTPEQQKKLDAMRADMRRREAERRARRDEELAKIR
jgi:Spy/CpxP family protein refolding chaperone